ncbi:MAG TPA: hypothetical protein VGQ39_04915, partial [Pyrinomonadaceae bacterium]|nr:hypothetical protein [Pyrinomonadaceae bacterium]
MKNSKLLLVVLTILFATAVDGEVRVPALIGDNMVLQQGKKVRIWGSALPNERVTVALDKNTASATTDAN